jgi:hypothetical protein
MNVHLPSPQHFPGVTGAPYQPAASAAASFRDVLAFSPRKLSSSVFGSSEWVKHLRSREVGVEISNCVIDAPPTPSNYAAI